MSSEAIRRVRRHWVSTGVMISVGTNARTRNKSVGMSAADLKIKVNYGKHPLLELVGIYNIYV